MTTATAAFALGGALVGFALAAILTAWAAHDIASGIEREVAWHRWVNWLHVGAILAGATLAGLLLAVGLDGLLELAGWWP